MDVVIVDSFKRRLWDYLPNGNFQVRITNVSGSPKSDFSLDWVAARVHCR